VPSGSGRRLLLSEDFAAARGRSAAGSAVREISVEATMRPIEVSHVVEGDQSDVLPALATDAAPGPDVIVET
jgi:hypothetical protein